MAWLLAMGILDGLVLGESLSLRRWPGAGLAVLLICATVAWGNRHVPRNREQNRVLTAYHQTTQPGERDQKRSRR